MEELTVMLLALGLTGLAEFKDQPIFRLASSGLFLFLGFSSSSPLLMIPMLGISVWQFYKTFWGES